MGRAEKEPGSGATMSPERCRRLIAAAVAGGDVTALGIARFAHVDLVEAREAFSLAVDSGLMAADGTMDPAVAANLVAELPRKIAAEIHARAARQWIAAGPEHLVIALGQIRSASTDLPKEELIDICDRAGQLSLSVLDYASAVEFFRLAVDLEAPGHSTHSGSRLCNLASALDGLGMVSEARECLSRAAAIGELSGDGELVARAAVGCAIPVDWQAGDSLSSALLARAESMNLSESSRTKILAARGMAEMRIPVAPVEEHQLAWVTRPGVAQAFTDEALERSRNQEPEVQALATLAWRATHRAPEFLERRRSISKSALDLAQIVRQPNYQVESAVWLAVDALESADRGLYDEALSVAHWVAQRDSNPRLIWRAHTLMCGAAHLDGNIDEAESWKERARSVGAAISFPGWLAADFLFFAQGIIRHEDPEIMKNHLLDEGFPALTNPIGRALAALPHARVGNVDIATRMVRRALRQLDPESSYLLLLTRCAAVVEVTGDAVLATEIAKLLEPWRGWIAVDSNAWWCDGPIDRWLVSMWVVSGRHQEVASAAATAEIAARSINDVRSLEALSRFTKGAEGLGPPGLATSEPRSDLLSARQSEILRLMAAGLTNGEIANHLAYSISTVRLETMAIYRVLGVKGRAEAVARFVDSTRGGA